MCRFRLLFEGCVDDGFVCPLQYTLSQETVDYLKKPTFDIWHWEPNEVRTQSYSCRQKTERIIVHSSLNVSKTHEMLPERATPTIYGAMDTLQDGVKPALADTDPAARRYLVSNAQK